MVPCVGRIRIVRFGSVNYHQREGRDRGEGRTCQRKNLVDVTVKLVSPVYTVHAVHL
jgi:hypothetical protein